MNKEKMHEQWHNLKEWWGNLAPREQRALKIGGVLLTMFILYAGMWSPFLTSNANMRKQIQTQQKILAWMQRVDKEIQRLSGQEQQAVKPNSLLMLLSILQKQVKHGGLESAMTSLKQSNNDSVEMHFQKVEFDKLITVLTLMVKDHHISITQMSVIADTTPGLVSADIVIK